MLAPRTLTPRRPSVPDGYCCRVFMHATGGRGPGTWEWQRGPGGCYCGSFCAYDSSASRLFATSPSVLLPRSSDVSAAAVSDPASGPAAAAAVPAPGAPAPPPPLSAACAARAASISGPGDTYKRAHGRPRGARSPSCTHRRPAVAGHFWNGAAQSTELAGRMRAPTQAPRPSGAVAGHSTSPRGVDGAAGLPHGGREQITVAGAWVGAAQGQLCRANGAISEAGRSACRTIGKSGG